MIRPMPTIRRKPKNGMITGGRSSGGYASSPISFASQLPEAMKLPSFGTSIANKFRSAEERYDHRWTIFRRVRFEPNFFRVPVAGGDEAAKLRHLDRQQVPFCP